MTWRLAPLLLLVAALASPARGAPLEILPFQTANRSPAIQIFGLPGPGTALLLSPGESRAELALDLANNFTQAATAGESAFFDSESYRLAFAFHHGLAAGFEAGIEIPYLRHSGGHLDGFIEGFHDLFGMPQGGRTSAPRNRLYLHYRNSGQREEHPDHASGGLGDLRLHGAWQLLRSTNGAPRGGSLHLALKLPTGDSDRLLGSGGTDLALWGAGAYGFDWRDTELGLFGALGALLLSEGEVLEQRQRPLVGFATLGGGWRPAPWIVFKLQLDGHTSFYHSELVQLGAGSVQLTLGGDLALGPATALEIGVGEDLATETAPDVVFRFALRSRF